MKALLQLRVNGREHELYLPVQKTLLEVLRENLGLVGTKHGCELGECGACTVLIDGEPRLACLTLPATLGSAEVTTIEHLGTLAHPHPLQANFAALGAAQCGYCTPGMLLTASALLEHNPAPDEAEIKTALAGNLCRCTGYRKIIGAIQLTAAQTRAGTRAASGMTPATSAASVATPTTSAAARAASTAGTATPAASVAPVAGR